ncbi:MAG: hypothetical protein RMX65_001610 [Nostoc sp. DedQUE01]|nr:hypothetical protein [Nostoc sp. DedQUE01]
MPNVDNRVLQNRQELEYVLYGLTYELLTSFNVPTKWHNQIKLLPQETVLTELEFNSLLDTYLSKLGSQYRTRVLEAAAISFYHQQSQIPVVEFLVCDDAPQFKLITDNLALC